MSISIDIEEVSPPPDLTNFIVKTDIHYSNGGSFGDVYRCWYNHGTDAPKQVAVKAFRFKFTEENESSRRSDRMIRRELGIWKRLDHDNIVPFLGIAYGFGMQRSVSLVSLWMSNGTLLNYIESHDHELHITHRFKLLLDIANGLECLHSFPIVHGDLNCNNVLIDVDCTARLVDFGYASLVGNIPEALSYLEMSSTRPGAMRWAAPETVLPQAGFEMTTKSDIYSFGCITLQVLSGKKPWSEVERESNIVLFMAQGREPGRPEIRAIDDPHWEFIRKCWSSIRERPSANELIKSIQQFSSHYCRLHHLHNLFLSSTSRATVGISSNSTLGDGPLTDLLPSTTDKLLSICPRFRLLVIGNSGVGKTALIQKTFGVKGLDVSETPRVPTDIDRELVAEENGLFVLHDSPGLEVGDDNLNKITNFIRRRREMAYLKDKLHAVWVCLEIPYAGGQLFGAGFEEFLRNRWEILGDIPVVVVLTKLDLLDMSMLTDFHATDIIKSPEEAQSMLLPRRSRFLDEFCAKPLVRAAGGAIPWVAVSTGSGFGLEPTITELVRTTAFEIERHASANPAYAAFEYDASSTVAGIASRASSELKVAGTLALWKRRYWGIMRAILTFSGDNGKEYLSVIHKDIITCWNFQDPDRVLEGGDFKAALLDTPNLEAHGVLATSQTVVKLSMAYIVDLVYVLKILFVLSRKSVTSQDVDLALKIYEVSTYRTRVHLEIRNFSTILALLPGGRGVVMEKTRTLINRFNITADLLQGTPGVNLRMI